MANAKAGTKEIFEDVLEPDIEIIDPHHHLWDRPLTPGEQRPPPKHGFEHVFEMVPRYLFDDLAADMKSGHNVIATVYMEAHAMYRADGPDYMKSVGETEFIAGVAAQSASGVYGKIRACAAIVGGADLTVGDKVDALLDAHIAAAGGRFRGVRNIAAYDSDPEVLGPLTGRCPPGFYKDERLRDGIKKLTKKGLSFDAWLIEPQLQDAYDLFKAFPDTTFILDHVGTPVGIGQYKGKREERFAGWLKNMQAIAKLPNVNLKVGGLAMVFPGFDSFLSNPESSSEVIAAEWKPYIEPCIEAFGTKRCMFESNFPVDRGDCSYRTLWNAFKRVAKGYSTSEKADLFSETARRVYKVEL